MSILSKNNDKKLISNNRRIYKAEVKFQETIMGAKINKKITANIYMTH